MKLNLRTNFFHWFESNKFKKNNLFRERLQSITLFLKPFEFQPWNTSSSIVLALSSTSVYLSQNHTLPNSANNSTNPKTCLKNSPIPIQLLNFSIRQPKTSYQFKLASKSRKLYIKKTQRSTQNCLHLPHAPPINIVNVACQNVLLPRFWILMKKFSFETNFSFVSLVYKSISRVKITQFIPVCRQRWTAAPTVAVLNWISLIWWT